MSANTPKTPRIYPSLGLALWEILHPMLQLALLNFHFFFALFLATGGPSATGISGWMLVSCYLCFGFVLHYWLRYLAINWGQIDGFGATLFRKALSGEYSPAGSGDDDVSVIKTFNSATGLPMHGGFDSAGNPNGYGG